MPEIKIQDREQWLNLRRKVIGGSDAAAVLGISPWKSRWQLWLEKTGQISDEIPDSPRMEWGRILEPVVANYYKTTNEVKITNRNVFVVHPEFEYLGATPDRWIGRHGLLEVKTGGAHQAAKWADQPPLYYQTQGMHYLLVTGREWCDFAALIGGNTYYQYRLHRDETVIAIMLEEMAKFWQCVSFGVDPGIDLHAANVEILSRMSDLTEAKEATDDIVEALELKRQAAADLKLAKGIIEHVDEEVKCWMGTADGIVRNGQVLATWKSSTTTGFDAKALKAKYPKASEKFVTKTNKRTFLLKGEK